MTTFGLGTNGTKRRAQETRECAWQCPLLLPPQFAISPAQALSPHAGSLVPAPQSRSAFCVTLEPRHARPPPSRRHIQADRFLKADAAVDAEGGPCSLIEPGARDTVGLRPRTTDSYTFTVSLPIDANTRERNGRFEPSWVYRCWNWCSVSLETERLLQRGNSQDRLMGNSYQLPTRAMRPFDKMRHTSGWDGGAERLLTRSGLNARAQDTVLPL